MCAKDNLVVDDSSICRLAYEHGALDKLATVVTSITPPASSRPEGWDEAESIEIGALREASCSMSTLRAGG
jgi:hypothetical protein